MTDSVSLVTSQLMKLLNVKWVTVAILIGRDGLVVVATLATKTSDCDSEEAVLDHLPKKSPNHVTSLVSSATPVWSLFKILMNSDYSPVATTRPTSSTQMNFIISKIKLSKESD